MKLSFPRLLPAAVLVLVVATAAAAQSGPTTRLKP